MGWVEELLSAGAAGVVMSPIPPGLVSIAIDRRGDTDGSYRRSPLIVPSDDYVHLAETERGLELRLGWLYAPNFGLSVVHHRRS